MGVFRDAAIEWQGKAYRFTPSMRLLREIEREVSIVHTHHAIATGKPITSHMAFIIATVMRHAGADVTEDELFAELSAGDALAVMPLYSAVMDAITPQRPEAKKADAAPDA